MSLLDGFLKYSIMPMYGCFIAGFLKMRESNGYPENEDT
jgi:hypothetical protein